MGQVTNSVAEAMTMRNEIKAALQADFRRIQVEGDFHRIQIS